MWIHQAALVCVVLVVAEGEASHEETTKARRLRTASVTTNFAQRFLDENADGDLLSALLYSRELQSATPRPSMGTAMTPAPVPRTLQPTRRPMTTPKPAVIDTVQPTKSVVTQRPTQRPTRVIVDIPTPRPTSRPSRAMTSRPTSIMMEPTPSPLAATPRPTRSMTSRPSLAPVEEPTTVAPTPTVVAPTPPGQQTVFDLIVANRRLSTFETTIVAADVQDEFDIVSPLTAFAPPNQAFNQLGADYINMLVTDPNFGLHLDNLVLNHATGAGSFLTTDFSNGQRLRMLSGETIDVIVNDTGVFLSTFANRLDFTGVTTLTVADQVASNGVLHRVNNVLAPAWFFLNLVDVLGILDPRFSTLVSLSVSAGVQGTLANAVNSTLVAPTNDAFNALDPEILAFLTDPDNVDQLRDVLLYNLIPQVINFSVLPLGDNPYVASNGDEVIVKVVRAEDQSLDVFFNDAFASIFFLTKWNIMYQVDGVLLPPGFSLTPTTAPPVAAPAAEVPTSIDTPVGAPILAPTEPPVALSTESIIGVISANNDLSTLKTFLETANLTAFLDSAVINPSTYFAPTNEAFTEIGADYTAKLLTSEYDLQLVNMLYYHLLLGQGLTEADLVAGLTLKMFNTLSVTVSESNGGKQLLTPSVELGLTPRIKFVETDTETSNGILHEIDSVIYPYWYFFDTLAAIRSLDGVFNDLSAIINAVGLEDTIGGLQDATIFGPNNDAIANLPQSTKDFINDPENADAVKTIIEYHIIEEMVPFTQLPVGDSTFMTRAGEDVTLTITETDTGALITVNGIPVTTFWLSKEAIVYELSGLLIPDSLSETIPVGSSGVPTGEQEGKGLLNQASVLLELSEEMFPHA